MFLLDSVEHRHQRAAFFSNFEYQHVRKGGHYAVQTVTLRLVISRGALRVEVVYSLVL
jgi:hypothetical protein